MVLLSACAPLKQQTPTMEKQELKIATNDAATTSASSNEKPPVLPAKGYYLKSLPGGLYFFSTGKNDTLFAVTSEGTLMLDPLKGAGETLQKALIEVKAPPVKTMIYTHANLGRIGSASMFSENVRVVAHRETAQFISEFGESNIPKPSILFGKKYSLEIGGLRVSLVYPEKAGNQGKVIIYFPDQKILMYVNAATPKTAPPKNIQASDIFRRAKGLKEVLKYDFETYASGNYYRPGAKKEMQEILNYYFATKSANKKALQSIASVNKAVKQDPPNNGPLLEEGYKSIVASCFKLLEPRWGNRLRGFDESAKKHCSAWTNFHLRPSSSR